MSDEEAHRLLSSGRTRSLPSIQRVIDRKEKQIAKKKATGKSKLYASVLVASEFPKMGAHSEVYLDFFQTFDEFFISAQG